MYEVNQPEASTGRRAPLSCMLELKYFASMFCEQIADGNYVIALKLMQKSTDFQLATFQKEKPKIRLLAHSANI